MPALATFAAITTLLPLLRPALRKILRLTEDSLPPKSGPDKLDMAIQLSKVLIDKWKARQDLDPNLPITDDGLVGIIESVLAELKSVGAIGVAGAPPANPHGTLPTSILVVRGTVVQLTEGPLK